MQNRSMPPGDVIPEIPYRDISEAVSWLSSAFGFQERLRIADHRAQISVGTGSFVVVQGNPEAGKVATMIRVSDIDSHYSTAVAFGAHVFGPPETYPYGERQYSTEDLAGHRWVFSQSVADVDPADWGGQLIT